MSLGTLCVPNSVTVFGDLDGVGDVAGEEVGVGDGDGDLVMGMVLCWCWGLVFTLSWTEVNSAIGSYTGADIHALCVTPVHWRYWCWGWGWSWRHLIPHLKLTVPITVLPRSSFYHDVTCQRGDWTKNEDECSNLLVIYVHCIYKSVCTENLTRIEFDRICELVITQSVRRTCN